MNRAEGILETSTQDKGSCTMSVCDMKVQKVLNLMLRELAFR